MEQLLKYSYEVLHLLNYYIKIGKEKGSFQDFLSKKCKNI
jgi:hypothetical protein